MAAVSYVSALFHADDANGSPLVGGKLYTYTSGTTTPATTYSDPAGGTPNTNPVILNSRGEARVYLMVGASYTFALTDSAGNALWTVDGVTGPLTGPSLTAYAPLDSPQLIGTPTTSTPGPNDNSTLIVNTAWVRTLIASTVTGLSASLVPTGVIQHYAGSTAPAGWVIRDGKTIGNASSNATGRANADTSALFALIWANTDNTTDGGAFQLKDSGGSNVARGASAAADFTANRQLPLPNDLGLFDRARNSTGSGYDPSRVLLSSQTDDFKAHHHAMPGTFSISSGGGGSLFANSGTTNTQDTGGTETRPANRAYTPIIKL